eukprot:scaffold50759_cov27-Phaeocystis_antarctica.AAC.2
MRRAAESRACHSLRLPFLLVAAVVHATGGDDEHQHNDAAGRDHGYSREARGSLGRGSASGQWRRTWRTVNAGGRRIRRGADENNTVRNGETKRLRTDVADAIGRIEHRAGARTVGNVDGHLRRVCGVLRQEVWRGCEQDGARMETR